MDCKILQVFVKVCRFSNRAFGMNLTKTPYLVLFIILVATAVLSSIDPASGGVGDIDIRDDITGGDCTSVGDWNNGNKTCKLTTDISLPVVLQNDNVTLNCDDHIINGTGSGIGIFADFKNFVTVENCKVTNFGAGLQLKRLNNATVNASNFTEGGTGIFLDRSSDNNLTGNRVIDNEGRGIFLRIGSGNTLINNTSSGNGGDGIVVGASDFNEIKNSIIVGNDIGIYIQSSNNNTITGTTVINHTSEGIFLDQFSDNNTFKDTLVNNNSDIGIFFVQSDNNAFFNLTANDNLIGVWVDFSDNVTLANVTIANNSMEGLKARVSTGTEIKNLIGNNNSLGMQFQQTNATMKNIILTGASPIITSVTNSIITLTGIGQIFDGDIMSSMKGSFIVLDNNDLLLNGTNGIFDEVNHSIINSTVTVH